MRAGLLSACAQASRRAMPSARRALVLLAVAGCARRLPRPRAAPPSEPGPGVTVTLLWEAPADLDLYVTDPALETLYFANRRTAAGGALEQDVRCTAGRHGVQAERARWTAPPAGRYRVGVDFPEACDGRTKEAPFRVQVDVDGRRRESTGGARRTERA